MPRIKGQDHAIWRRLLLVPFARKFWNPDMNEKPPNCPQCHGTDLRTEDATTGRHQCRRCLWRCIVGADGSTRDMVAIATTGRGRRNPANRTGRDDTRRS